MRALFLSSCLGIATIFLPLAASTATAREPVTTNATHTVQVVRRWGYGPYRSYRWGWGYPGYRYGYGGYGWPGYYGSYYRGWGPGFGYWMW